VNLPVETLKRRSAAAHCDVAIVGAGLGGLVCAAILARAGRRVVLIDRAKRPGGRLQTANHQGFAVDLGPPLWEAPGLLEALAAAGVEDHGLVPLSSKEGFRLSIAAESGPEAPCPLPVPGAVPAPSILDAVRRLYGVQPRVFAGLGELYGELGDAAAAARESGRDVELSAWLAERGAEPALAAAMVRSAALLGAPDGARASVVSLATQARELAEGAPTHYVCGDTPVAGARGVVQALVDVVIEAGGELRLGTRAMGIAFESGRFARLALRREEVPFLEEVAAERCVLAVPSNELRSLLPAGPRGALERLLPDASLRELSVAWAVRGDVELPSTREGESPAVIRLVAPIRGEASVTAGATFVCATASAPRLAPGGHALLRAVLPVGFDTIGDAGEIERRVDGLRAALVALVPEVSEAVVWEHCWLGESPAAVPLRRPVLPLVAPSCSGLWLASQDVQMAGASATGVTGSAVAGRAVAERIVAEGSAAPEGSTVVAREE